MRWARGRDRGAGTATQDGRTGFRAMTRFGAPTQVGAFLRFWGHIPALIPAQASLWRGFEHSVIPDMSPGAPM